MYIGFYSDTLPTNNVTDYLVRVVKPKLDSDRRRADRRDPRRAPVRAARLARRGARWPRTASPPTDVCTALAANNYLAALGASQGPDGHRAADRAAPTCTRVDEFKQLVVKQQRRRDRAAARTSPPSRSAPRTTTSTSPSAACARSSSASRSRPRPTSSTSPSACARPSPTCRAQLPTGVTGKIVYDSTDFINTSITRGRQDAGRGAAHRHRRDLPVPRQPSARCWCR